MYTLLKLGALLALTASTVAQNYVIEDTITAANFFDEFNFFSGSDPTHGYVDYASSNTANDTSLAGYSNGQVYLGVDHTTSNPSGGRASVRVTSNKAYTHGLFIADIAHMPGSICGVWPAFWTFGPNWPSSGEIDIIEGVNTANTNAVTLHTSSGCTMQNAGSVSGSVLAVSNCNADSGCSQSTSSTQSYGSGFNNNGGGVYAMEWTATSISVWFFPRSSVPGDITSGNPTPTGWGSPTTKFAGSGCDIDNHFSNHNMVFDTTFCGDWAGQVWGANSQCSALASTCQDYVANNPSAFREAYWLINSVKVYSSATSTKSKREIPFSA